LILGLGRGATQAAAPVASGTHLGEALTEAGGALPFHQPKHEQAMVHTALGYAKATRRLASTSRCGP